MILEEILKEGKEALIQVVVVSVSSATEAKDKRIYRVIKVSDGFSTQSLYVWGEQLNKEIFTGAFISVIAKVVKTNKVFFSCDSDTIMIQFLAEIPLDSPLRQVKLCADEKNLVKIQEMARSFADMFIEHKAFKSMIYEITDTKVLSIIKDTPAGKANHHAYKGGLLEHMYEMLQMYVLLAENASVCEKLRHEIVIIGILLHDFFKYKDYNYDGTNFEMTEEGVLVGHVFAGANFALKFMNKEGFTPSDKSLMVHALLSHHLNLEWGAPVKAATKEAVILHYLDQISAKFNAFDSTNNMEYCNILGTSIVKNH